jgi:adenylate cyclase
VLFLFEDHVLDVARRELRRGNTVVPVEPQVFDLLLYLIRNRDRVVSKEDLIAGVWNGRIVSESTLQTRINAARRAVNDDGKQQRLIRTATRKGVRFIGSVREQSEPVAASGAPTLESAVAAPLPPPIADRPSIAVLPFENLSEDSSLELLANGLVEDVIALLARVAGFFVIARASTFLYRPASLDVRRVGLELGVRYVVTGSVRASGGRVRVAAQLIEAERGTQLWAARYDVERGDTLDLQDRIAREIIVELEPALTKAEMSMIRRRRTESFDAWSHFRQASAAIALGGWNEQSIAEGIGHLRKAIPLDQDFALARAYLALLSAFGANLSLIADDPAAREEAFAEAERAVALDPNGSDVLGYAGCALADLGEVKRGCELLERAVELDPSNAQACIALGVTQTRLQQFDSGIENLRLGMRLSPRDFRLAFWGMLLADALVRARRLEEALAEATIASRRDARLYGSRVVAAWALAKLDRREEARGALAEARRIRPRLSLDEVRRFFGDDAGHDLASLWD